MKYTQRLLNAQETNATQIQQLELAQQELKVSNEQLLREKDEQIVHAIPRLIIHTTITICRQSSVSSSLSL